MLAVSVLPFLTEGLLYKIIIQLILDSTPVCLMAKGQFATVWTHDTPRPPYGYKNTKKTKGFNMSKNRAARFVTRNYDYETGSMTGILGQLKWNPLRKGERIIDSYCYTKVWKVKPRYLLMTLFPRLGMAGISTPWPFRYPQPVKMSICIASSPRLSGTGMTSLNPWFLPLNCQMIAYLSSPLLWELGTNFPQSQPLVKDCQFGVSPVNYSDSDSEYPNHTLITNSAFVCAGVGACI